MEQIEKKQEEWQQRLYKQIKDQNDETLQFLKQMGVIPLLVFIFSVLYGYAMYLSFQYIYTTFIAHRIGHSVQWNPMSKSWAVITGATSGIGLEYANKLSEMGYSLLLLSRDEEKLEKTRAQLLDKNKICQNINTFAVDFTRTDIYDSIKNELDKLDNIDVLVNNVGMFGPQDYFLETPDIANTIEELIYCNTLSMTQIINLCLPQMLRKRNGVIINISSFAALVPVPLMAMYSATKVYVDFLSRALELEYRDKGIVIQSVMPGVVGNRLFDPVDMLVKLKVGSKLIASPLTQMINNVKPAEFVDDALKTVGVEKQTYGHWLHKIMLLNYYVATKFFGDEILSTVFYHFLKFKKADYDYNSIKFFPQIFSVSSTAVPEVVKKEE